MKNKHFKRLINNDNFKSIILIIGLFFVVFIVVTGNTIFKGTRATDVIKYKLTFDKNDELALLNGADILYAVNGSSVVLANNTDNTVGTIPVASKDNYLFTGWWTSSVGGELVIYPSSDVVESAVLGYVQNQKWQLSDNVTLYAQYVENGYRVTYNCQENGGTTNNIYRIYSAGEDVSLTRQCKKSDLNTQLASYADWTFVGWNTDMNATVGLDNYTVQDSDIELYAIYKKESLILKAKWSLDGEDVSSQMPTTCTISAVYNKTQQADSCIVNPPVVTPNEGYVFIGWNYDKNAKVNSEAYNISTNELTLLKSGNISQEESQFSPDEIYDGETWYAIVDTVSYKVTFDPVDGVLTGSNQLYAKNNENLLYRDNNSNRVGDLPVATKNGFTFNGWWTESNDDGLQVIDRFGNLVTNNDISGYILAGNWNLNDDIVLYAHYNMADEFNSDENINLEFSDNNSFSINNTNNILYQINPGMTSTELFSKVLTDVSLYIIDSDNNAITENVILKTGYKLRAQFENSVVDYKISVKGDVLGTGELSYANALQIGSYIIDKTGISGEEYLLAADYDGNGQIKMNDVIKILLNRRS